MIINAGDRFYREFVITKEVMDVFSQISGDNNPIHLDDSFAQSKGFPARIAFGNILGFLISALVGVGLPTNNTMLISQSVKYRKPCFIDDTITLEASVDHVSEATGICEMKLVFTNQHNERIASGQCQAMILGDV